MSLTGKLFKGDRIIWIVFMLLCVTSIIEVFSAASILTFETDDYWAPITRHVLFMLIGVGFTVSIQYIPYRFFKLIPFVLLPLSILLLVFVFFKGESTNDAARWLKFGGVTFQPSELAKLSVIATVAFILGRSQTPEGTSKSALKPILIVTGITGLFIISENFSTAVLLFAIVYIMLIIGRIPTRQMLKLTATLIIVAVVGIGAIVLAPKDFLAEHKDNSLIHRVETWQSRINDFSMFNKREAPENFKFTDKNRQRTFATIAIADSNIIGKMPGNSEWRNYLSQAFSDFIFAIVIEELGLIGSAFIVLMFLILLVRAGKIAKKSESPFAAFLVLGLTLAITLQAIVNMMVAVDFLPITGQTLPLISRGGTSFILNCINMGIILSISRHVEQKEEEKMREEEESQNNEMLSAIPEEYNEI